MIDDDVPPESVPSRMPPGADGPRADELQGQDSAAPGDLHVESVESSAPAAANVVRIDFKRSQRASPRDPTAPQKYGVFSRFIQKGKVMVTLDARRPGVSVPRHFADEQQLNLDFSERFGLADFTWDERGVRASLSFNRQPFFCDVPWSAVYALFSHVDNERLTWARSLPVEILDQLPEASIEHLERVLELQVERLLRSAREQHERELKSVDHLGDDGDNSAPEAGPDVSAEAEALLAAADTSSSEPETIPDRPSRGDDGDNKPTPPRGPGLRLVRS